MVPQEQLLALALGKGPSGDPLDFRHFQRSQQQTLDQLGRLLINVCRVVPEVGLEKKYKSLYLLAWLHVFNLRLFHARITANLEWKISGCVNKIEPFL